MKHVTFLSLRLIVLLALIGSLVIARPHVAFAADFNECSDYDDYDSYGVRSSYNISYLCIVLLESQPDYIWFFINMTQATRTTMFNDGLGSWAAVLIDTNADDQWDIQIQTIDQTYPYSTAFVPARAYVNNVASACPADTYMNVPQAKRYVAFRISHRCLNLNPSGWKWKGYVDYIAGDSTGFDYSSGVDRSDGGWWIDFSSFTRSINTTTTSTTTTTTTTTVAVSIPVTPGSVTVTKVGQDSVRVIWSDVSTNEDGFLIQRNDLPVPAGTTVAAWPYKVNQNVTEWTATGLAPGSQICVAIAAFNSAGASSFTPFSCMTTDPLDSSNGGAASLLTCNGKWSTAKNGRSFLQLSTDAANAGKLVTFEAFSSTKWIRLGTTRIKANGVAKVRLSGANSKLRGKVPIRGTQGSRFICEGDAS